MLTSLQCCSNQGGHRSDDQAACASRRGDAHATYARYSTGFSSELRLLVSYMPLARWPCHKSFSWSSRPVAPRRRRGGLGFIISYCVLTRVGPVRSTTLTIPETRNRRSIPLTGLKMKLLVALWALAGTVSALLPVIVPLNDDANGTQWGPVTADISANRCRAFAVDFDVRRRRGPPRSRRASRPSL